MTLITTPPQTKTPAAVTTPPVAEGFVQEKTPERIILDVPHTDYEIYLKPVNEIAVDAGEWIRGIISLDARRVAVMQAGGKFVEPVYGRPRRVQGAITGGDVSKNQVFINAAVPIVVNLIDSQKASDFAIGQIIGFDAMAGATFEAV